MGWERREERRRRKKDRRSSSCDESKTCAYIPAPASCSPLRAAGLSSARHTLAVTVTDDDVSGAQEGRMSDVGWRMASLTRETGAAATAVSEVTAKQSTGALDWRTSQACVYHNWATEAGGGGRHTVAMMTMRWAMSAMSCSRSGAMLDMLSLEKLLEGKMWITKDVCSSERG